VSSGLANRAEHRILGQGVPSARRRLSARPSHALGGPRGHDGAVIPAACGRARSASATSDRQTTATATIATNKPAVMTRASEAREICESLGERARPLRRWIRSVSSAVAGTTSTDGSASGADGPERGAGGRYGATVIGAGPATGAGTATGVGAATRAGRAARTADVVGSIRAPVPRAASRAVADSARAWAFPGPKAYGSNTGNANGEYPAFTGPNFDAKNSLISACIAKRPPRKSPPSSSRLGISAMSPRRTGSFRRCTSSPARARAGSRGSSSRSSETAQSHQVPPLISHPGSAATQNPSLLQSA
jgi:hypothetical protein